MRGWGCWLSGALAFVGAFFVLAAAKSAIHEIQGMILLLIAAVYWSAWGIIRALPRPAAATPPTPQP